MMIKQTIKKLSFITLTSLGILSSNASAQTLDKCSQHTALSSYLQAHPEGQTIMEAEKVLKQQFQQQYDNNTNIQRSGTVYYIPVVFHVVHDGGVSNISDEQILDALDILNEDFRKLNTDVNSVNSNFSSITADIEIEFRLAQKKPDGSCFSGITRTLSSEANAWSEDDVNVIQAQHGDFPGNMYMNIFIVNGFNQQGAAGYTYLPGWPHQSSMKNGINIIHDYIGSFGTGSTYTSRALTHEVGHWLDLPHTWGGTNAPGVSSNCSDDDGIGDTPNTIGWTSCNTSGSTCSSLDNVENYMEYSYCTKMFTTGQKTVMRSAINSSVGGRSNVISTSNHTATGIFANLLCTSDFEVSQTIACENTPITFYDKSYHNPTSWNWSFPGGTPSSSTSQNPSVTYTSAGLKEVSLTVTNASGTKSTTKTNYIQVIHNGNSLVPFSEGFENDFQDNWFVKSDDANSWEVTTNASFTGTKSVFLNNLNNNIGEEDELESSTYYLQGVNGSPTLDFKYAYARTTSTEANQDKLQVYFSSNCGETWVLRRGLNTTVNATNSNFVPTSQSDWSSTSISIPSSYYSNQFRFKITSSNSDGNNIYIDDININGATSSSIDEFDSKYGVSIYPNPTNGIININLNTINKSEITINLMDVSGRRVSTITQGTNTNEFRETVNLSNYKSGIYFLEFNINQERFLRRIILN